MADEPATGPIVATASARSRAPRSVVFALLKDGGSWPDWSMFEAFALERPGDEDPSGVGSVRVFSTRFSRTREEVTEIVEDRQLSYRLLSGIPLKNYRATVTLSDDAGATTIMWTASFGPQPPGTGFLWRLFVGWLLRRTARDLAIEAERGGHER